MPWLSWDSWSMVQRCASESYRHFSRMRHGRTFHVKRTMPLETFSTSQFVATAAAKRLHLDWLCRLLVPTTSFFSLCRCHVVSLLGGSAVARHASPARFRRPLTMRVSTRPNRPRLRLRLCPPTPRPRHTVKMAPGSLTMTAHSTGHGALLAGECRRISDIVPAASLFISPPLPPPSPSAAQCTLATFFQ